MIVKIMQTSILSKVPGTPSSSPAQAAAGIPAIIAAAETIIRRVRIYCRWLIITTMAAPNPTCRLSRKGGEQ